MRYRPVLILLAAGLMGLGSCQEAARRTGSSADTLPGEVMYHLFERSFFDTNGDGNGDFRGIDRKLDYLQDLGVNALLVTPIFKSVFYHNYFADDFFQTDPSYGSVADWIALVQDIHRRHMKIYLDMEIQYVTDRQLWFRDSYKNPRSPYSDYLLYHGPGNTKPEPIIYNISTLVGYNDSSRRVATVNLYDPPVQHYFDSLFHYWMDPNADGRFDDGVDGFRIDHMMDDLDNKGVLPHLFSRFWVPLFDTLRRVNPRLMIVAEQANWGDYGSNYFQHGGVNRVFAFHLRNAIASFHKEAIASAADSTFAVTPAGDQQVVFIENHDMQRFSSQVNGDPGKLRVGAALNLLIGGIPSVYYGQELGMFGKGGFGRFGNTDGNDIPQREAFEWFRADSGTGMAIWYKNTGPWWDSTNLKPGDGISLQEEAPDTASLWNDYRRLIHLHTTHQAFGYGKYREVSNDNDRVFSFLRYTPDSAALVVVNLSDSLQHVRIDVAEDSLWKATGHLKPLFGQIAPKRVNDHLEMDLPAYGVEAWGWQ